MLSTKPLTGDARRDRFARLRRRLAVKHPLDFNRTFDSLVFIAGSARSGTTWLAEVLNAENRHRLIFEPLHDRAGVLRERDLPRYIPPDTDDPALKGVVADVLLGKFKSDGWTGRINNRVVSRSRIIKDVHSNLRLGWFRAEFPVFPIILIIRHPCATAASRLRTGFRHQPFDRSIDNLRGDERLVEDHLRQFEAVLSSLSSEFEHAVSRWCVETLVPLRQLASEADVAVLFYEHLVADPDQGVRDIFRSIGEEPPAAAFEHYGVPSRTAFRGDRPLDSPTEALVEWKELLAEEQVSRAMELVAAFGLDALYGPEPQPRLHNFPQLELLDL